ncbi:MAG: hypothetical protein ABI294_09935 [Casimicrobiaceae bacterium]
MANDHLVDIRVHDVPRLQQMIRTTMRALAASTLRAHDPSSTRALIARAHSLNESLARSVRADGASAHIRDAADQTRVELAALADRATARADAPRA